MFQHVFHGVHLAVHIYFLKSRKFISLGPTGIIISLIIITSFNIPHNLFTQTLIRLLNITPSSFMIILAYHINLSSIPINSPLISLYQ